ncbi:MAG: hypothetical protein JWO46_1408, partial [Nocardioidaceae bacterium]|nr:hypothetical protein [Nocardioidaceae bacterium]
MLALVTLWLGPWCLLAGLLLLVLRPVRSALRATLTRRVGVGLVVAALVIAGVAVLVPDGWLPVPTGPGVLIGGPAYLGSAAERRPVPAAVPADPALGPQGD